MSGRAVWVLCPTDGTAHLLAVEGAHGVLLGTPCGRSRPAGILQHDRLPSRQLCRECVAAYLLPAPVFARLTPAGRRSSGPVRSPGGQPVPDLPAADTGCGWPAPLLPRWARYPVVEGHGREDLLGDPLRYARASRAAYDQARNYRPTHVAELLIKVVG